MSKYYVRFDDRCFANPNTDLEWTLRYGTESDIINLRHVLASYLGSYNWIMNATDKQRKYVCNKIKKLKEGTVDLSNYEQLTF